MSGCPAPTLLSRTASAKAQAAYNLALMPATDLPRLFAELPAELDAIYDPAAPWALLGDPLDCSFWGFPTGDPGDLVGVSANIGPLADNGGPTPTHALLRGSPAIDAGDPAGCLDAAIVPLMVDQRGSARPLDGDG